MSFDNVVLQAVFTLLNSTFSQYHSFQSKLNCETAFCIPAIAHFFLSFIMILGKAPNYPLIMLIYFKDLYFLVVLFVIFLSEFSIFVQKSYF